MEALIVGRPAMNIYLPLQEFPQEGDIFRITGKNESLGNVGATSACLLAKWKIKTHITGVIGNDLYADKLKETFKTYKVNTKYVETDFLKGTSVNYIVLNAKTGLATKVLYSEPTAQLQKYKYDFIPDYAIIDGTEFAGAQALLNNNGSVKTVFYAGTGDRDTIAMSKRCTYVVCTQFFAEALTKETTDGSAHSLVNFYQKIVDIAGNSNYIVILNNHKILYSQEGKVKMLPEMKINVADGSSFDSIFVGSLTFALMHGLEIDDAIKFANTAAAISLARIGEVPAIPEIEEVIDNSGLREKLGEADKKASSAATPESPAPLDPSYEITMPAPAQGVEQPQVEAQPQVEVPSQDAQIAFNQPTTGVEMPQPAPTSTEVAPVAPPPAPVETNIFDVNPNA